MTSTTKKIIIGVVLVVLLGLFVFGGLIGLAVYGHLAAEKAGNEAATIQNMKTIAAIEIQYYNTHTRDFGTFEQLIKERMLTSKFSGSPPRCDGYVWSLKVTPRISSQTSSYTLNADPQSSDTGSNHFYLDSTSGSIHINANQPAGPTDPSVASDFNY